MAQPPIFVITGQLAAGKSTVARVLLDRYPLGLHVDVDAVREMVTSGRASPLEWTDETTRQFDLAIRAASELARVYSEAGFAVAIEGGVDPAAIETALANVGRRDRMVGIMLRPRLDVALRRNRERTHKDFETSVLEDAMRRIDADIAADGERPGWHHVDNSDEPVDATAERILAIAQNSDRSR